MRRLLKLLLTLGLFVAPAFGQGVVISPQPALRNTGTTVAAMVNATVTVCAAGASGLPCTPALVGATFKDSALTQPLTDPFFTDANGNYSFAIAPGQYTVTVTQFGQGYSYQVTAQCPLNGTCTWTGNQVFNGNVTINGSCSGCGSGSPSAPAGSLQYANSTVSGFLGAAGITTPDGNSLVVKGPNPVANLAAFTRAAVGTGGCSTTATISLATPTTATLASATCFQAPSGNVTDGITILGAGAAVSMSTPGAPTVTPNTLAVGGTAMGGGASTPTAVVNGATGASTYVYKLIAKDKFGGFTPPGTATTITNGPATLGEFTCVISTMTRSASNVTATFTAPCAGAVVGAAALYVAASGDTTMNGYHNIQTVNSSSQVVFADQFDSTGFGWNNQASGTNSSTGGTAAFFNSNHLQWTAVTGAWEYYICAERPGDASFHLAGVTKPSTSTFKDIQFDDYGATFMANQVYPTYITDSVCNGTTGSPDPLTASITNLVGTTATLDTAATTAVTSATALFDNGPGLVKAAQSVAVTNGIPGTLLIPATTGANSFIINSYTLLPAKLNVSQAGTIYANETVEIPGPGTWDGSASSSCASLLFGYFTSSYACFYSIHANPTLYVSGDHVHISHLTLNVNANENGIVHVVDDSQHSDYDHIVFNLSGGTDVDFLSTGIVFRGDTSSNDAKHQLDYLSFSTSTYTTNPASWTGFISMPHAQAANTGVDTGGQGVLEIKHVSMNQRGFVNYGQVNEITIDDLNRQSGVMPLFWDVGTSSNADIFKLRHLFLDTDGSSLLTNSHSAGNPAFGKVVVDGIDLNPGAGLPFNGFGPIASNIVSPIAALNSTPNKSGFVRFCGLIGSTVATNCNFDTTAFIGPNAKMFFPLPAPSGLSAPAAAGGSLQADTVTVSISAVGPDGNQTVASTSVSTTTDGTCPGSGNCELSLSWSPPATGAAISYRINACYAAHTPVCASGINQQSTVVTGTTATLTTITQTGVTPASFTQTGQTGITLTYIRAPQGQFSEGTAPTCVANYDQIFGIASGHRLSFCNNTGSVDQVVGTATTDTLTNKTVSAGTFTGAGSGSGAILLTGQRDGLVPVNATTTTSCTFGTSSANCFDKAYVTGYAFNQDATAAAGVTYTLPVAQAGRQYCVANSYNGSAANTGVLTVATNTAGQFIIFTDGTLTASGGNVTSGGAAGDAACFVGIDSTHWQQFTQSGTWTKH